MKRTDQYLYLANGRLHRSLFGAINEKGLKNWTIKNQYLLYIFMEVLPEGLHME